MKKYNFNAGPCVLPPSAVEASIDAIRNFDNTGVGILEISHRSSGWYELMDECRALWRELLNIPDNYKILFLGGGASAQFNNIPANLLDKKAAFLDTGVWASKAIKEAKFYGDVEIVASSEDKAYSYIPKEYSIPSDADYFHITSNNTIYGTEMKKDIDSPIPLVADMSSNIMSKPLDVSKYGMIYGGAQKNVGPAGVAFVIIKEDILGKVERKLPSIVDYRVHIEKESMFNTPPVFPIYVMYETLKWVKSMGGVEAMYKINKKKAEMLYKEIDRNEMFIGTAQKEDRSLMNVCFVMSDAHKKKEEAFLNLAAEHNIVGIKGHRSVGGFRASIYNACSVEAVEALIKCMQEFESNNR